MPITVKQAAIVSLALFLVSGCGGDGDVPELAPVKGTVTFDGKPLADAEVEFQPEKGRSSRGYTDASGKYVLQYSQDHAGAIVGKHIVRVSTAISKEMEDGNDVETEETLPAKHHSESDRTEEVKPGENEINIDLEP